MKSFINRNKLDIDKGKVSSNENSIRNNNVTVSETYHTVSDTTPTRTEPIEQETEEKVINDYILFLKTSFDTFNKLFLSYSKHEFLKMIKQNKIEKSQNESDIKSNYTLSKCPSVRYGKSMGLKKKAKALFISSSLPDINQITQSKRQNNDDDNIIMTELNNQKEIMTKFLTDVKRKRVSFIKFNKQMSIKPNSLFELSSKR